MDVRGYATALLLTAVALLFWYAGIDRVGLSPFFLYFAAVIGASWWCGLGPGLLMTGLSLVAANFAYAFAFPGHFDLNYPRGVLQSVIFLFVAITSSWLNSERRTLLDRERQIRQRFERLAAEQGAMLSQMAEAVIIADTTGQARYLNDAAQRILGIDGATEDPVLQVMRDATVYYPNGEEVAPNDLDFVRAARGEHLVNAERIIRRPDGTKLHVVVNARPVSDTQGTMLGVVATVRDVTVERELEHEKEAILSAVVHDLRNPLTTIKGLTTLLARQLRRMDLPEEVSTSLARNLDGIDAKSNQMVTLMNEFMAAARSSETTEPIETTRVDLVGLIRHCVASHAVTSENHEIRVETPTPELVGYWDETQLERTIDNLIANAIKYSPAGGEIVVSVRPEGNGEMAEAVVTVRDQGIGIPESDQQRIFERFYRAANAAHVGGTGVGLASVKRIVERHGGAITLASQEGRGTTVEVRLPLREPPTINC